MPTFAGLRDKVGDGALAETVDEDLGGMLRRVGRRSQHGQVAGHQLARQQHVLPAAAAAAVKQNRHATPLAGAKTR